MVAIKPSLLQIYSCYTKNMIKRYFKSLRSETLETAQNDNEDIEAIQNQNMITADPLVVTTEDIAAENNLSTPFEDEWIIDDHNNINIIDDSSIK